MKRHFFYLALFLFISCNKDDDSKPTPDKFTFNYNLHSSLPTDWVDEFKKIMANLDKVIPIKPNDYLYELDIYVWNSSEDKPYKDKIGNTTGACICGNSKERYMVLEIPQQEFDNKAMHRYSVIPHEVFHAYEMGLSENFFKSDGLELKWMAEGGAASFESLYIQQYYSYDYFTNAQSQIHADAVNNPKIFESYDQSNGKDDNYASSVFMVLALVSELKKLNVSEEKAFKLIFKDFWKKNASNSNWKTAFQEVFNISADDFYSSLKNYSPSITQVRPDPNLKLENIFSN